MAAQKGKRKKTRKGTPSKKSRLWLRDLLNILGGLLVGSVGVWLILGYLDGRTSGKVSLRCLKVVEEAQPAVKPLAERYLAVTENPDGNLEVLKTMDISQPVCSLDALKTVQKDIPHVYSQAAVSLLEFYENLQEAELLRKLLIVQQEQPQEMSQVLTREFLRAVYDGAQLIPRLLWDLKANRGEG